MLKTFKMKVRRDGKDKVVKITTTSYLNALRLVKAQQFGLVQDTFDKKLENNHIKVDPYTGREYKG